MTFDLVIENGLVVDGTGSPGKRAPVGIAGMRIVAMGDLKGTEATRRLDATECAEAPGFMDSVREVLRIAREGAIPVQISHHEAGGRENWGKVRLTRSIVGNNNLDPLRLARRAAKALGMALMVHVGDTPSPLGEILSAMSPADLLTHWFHGRQHGILDERGGVLPEAEEAVRKGILFDVGHGVGSFSFEVARRALAAGLAPGTISSDLHFFNVNGPVFDLASTMSKFMLLGLPADEVLAKATSVSARLLGLADRLGSLREGLLVHAAGATGVSARSNCTPSPSDRPQRSPPPGMPG